VGLGCTACVIDGLTTPAFQTREVIRKRVRDGQGTDSRVMPFLSSQFGAPPLARRTLSMTEITHRDSISVLQIIGSRDFVLDIASPRGPPASKPRAAICAAPVAERQSLFQGPPVRLRSNAKPQPSRPSVEFCIADGTRHLLTQKWEDFGKYL